MTRGVDYFHFTIEKGNEMEESKRNRSIGWRLKTLVALVAVGFPNMLNSTTTTDMNEGKVYYCEYCGHKFPNVHLLVSAPCPRHPLGENKGRHKLYEGGERSEYTCKYCGRKFRSIMEMTGGRCAFHPSGENRGRHAPAL